MGLILCNVMKHWRNESGASELYNNDVEKPAFDCMIFISWCCLSTYIKMKNGWQEHLRCSTEKDTVLSSECVSSKDTSFKHMPNSDNTQQTSSLLSPRLQLILFNQVFHQLLVHPGYRHICSRLNDLTQL